MFALFAFGYLFGFVGLLIAVPLAAAIGVLMRFAMQQPLCKLPLMPALPLRRLCLAVDASFSPRMGRVAGQTDRLPPP